MTRILIIGAHGQIARVATQLFLDRPDTELTLYLRKSARLKALAQHPRVRIVEGDALDPTALAAAMQDQDVVYANLAGPMEQQARHIVDAMRKTGLRRLIFITSMGIYAEVPGQQYQSVLDPYRKAAAVVEASGLDYTILRPAWLNDRDEIAYGTTHKGEAFRAADETVSRKSVAALILKTSIGSNRGSSPARFGPKCCIEPALAGVEDGATRIETDASATGNDCRADRDRRESERGAHGMRARSEQALCQAEQMDQDPGFQQQQGR